eukprot:scaffold7272_cov124-Skeletonema_dohrnii-CCMP3373.AAC.7
MRHPNKYKLLSLEEIEKLQISNPRDRILLLAQWKYWNRPEPETQEIKLLTVKSRIATIIFLFPLVVDTLHYLTTEETINTLTGTVSTVGGVTSSNGGKICWKLMKEAVERYGAGKEPDEKRVLPLSLLLHSLQLTVDADMIE